MKKRLACLVFALALVAATLFVPATLASADAGSFSGSTDYSYGTGAGSGGSSSGDRDYDGGSSTFIFLPGSSASSDEDPGVLGWVVTIAIIAAVILIPMARQKHRSEERNSPKNMVDEFDSSKLRPMSALSDAEAPGFNADQMEEHIANLYPRLQHAWTDKDLEAVRPLLSEKLYAQLDRQLDELRHAHRTNKVDDITVMDVQLSGWYEEGDNVSVVALVQTRIKDYVVDDRTGEVVSGDPKAEKFMKYRYTLTQPKGAPPADQTQTNCPNCGAPIDINKSAECPYCGTIIKSASYTWVVTSIQGLEQRTA